MSDSGNIETYIRMMNKLLSNMKFISVLIVMFFTFISISFVIIIVNLINGDLTLKDVLAPMIISLSALLASSVAMKNMTQNEIEKIKDRFTSRIKSIELVNLLCTMMLKNFYILESEKSL